MGAYKLVNLDRVISPFRRNSPSWLEAELSRDEARKLQPLSDAAAEKSYTLTGRLRQMADALYCPDGLGYVSPEKVRRHYVAKERNIYTRHLVHSVSIDFADGKKGDTIGKYWYHHKPEGKSDSPVRSLGNEPLGLFLSGEAILSGPVFAGDKIDSAFISEDNSGKYIPITKERILSLLQNAGETAGGHLNPGFWRKELDKAEKLAKASGLDLSYDVSEARKRAEAVHSEYPQKHKQRLEERSMFTGSPRYKAVLLSDELVKSWEEGMEEYDDFSYGLAERRGSAEINSSLFPYYLESLSTQNVIELMKHFAVKGHALDYIQEHMKIEKIEDSNKS